MCRMAAMGSDDWYRATTWDAETAEAFETRLARSRTRYHRSSYLHIQGWHLIQSPLESDRQVGRDLLRRAIDEDDEDQFNARGAWQDLAGSLAADDHLDEAEEALRETVRLTRQRGISGTTGTAELDLAELLIRLGEPDQVAEAIELLIAVQPEVEDQSFLAGTQFRFNLVCARAARSTGNPAAGTFARRALAIADDGTSGVPRHDPVLRMVQVGPVTRGELQGVSDAYPDDLPIDDVGPVFGGPARVEVLDEDDLATLPLLADLRAAGVDVENMKAYWTLLQHPTEAALPVLMDALTRQDLPDAVRRFAAMAFAMPVARPYWDRLVSILYALAGDAESEWTREWLASALSELADRTCVDDVLAILRSPELGTDRIGFLVTLTRLRYRDRWTVIAEAANDPDLTVQASHMLHERAKREAKRTR